MRIGVVGDPHGGWGPKDLQYFDQSTYDLVLITGDLGGGTERSAIEVARSLGRMRKPTLVMLGNNDAECAPSIAAEIQHQRGLAALGTIGSGGFDRFGGVDGPRLCGYSSHNLDRFVPGLSLIAGRPFACGGDHFSYPERLAELYNVHSFRESEERLCGLVRICPGDKLIFLAHNGPNGLGDGPADIWGRDFGGGVGDHGDSDLTTAIDYAHSLGKKVLAVVGGHMHLRTRTGEERPVFAERNGVLFVNAARVPRVLESAQGSVRHHVALDIDPAGLGASANELFIPEG